MVENPLKAFGHETQEFYRPALNSPGITRATLPEISFKKMDCLKIALPNLIINPLFQDFFSTSIKVNFLRNFKQSQSIIGLALAHTLLILNM